LGSRFAAAALRTNVVLISDLHRSKVSGLVNMDYVVPVAAPREAADPGAIGVMLAEVEPEDFLFPSLQTWPTPSQTGETLLVRREGQEVVYLNELRHQTNTALNLRFSLAGRANLPAAKAALGQTGLVRGLDYRGVPVLAAILPVPDSPWYLVAKQDVEEVYAPLRAQAWMIGAMGALVVLAMVFGVRLLWRTREFEFSLAELEAQRKAELASRASAERFRSFTAAAFEGISVSENGRFVDVSDQYAAMFGYEPWELIGRDIAATVVAPSSRDTVTQAIGSDRETVYEHEVMRKDGTTFTAEVRAKLNNWEGRKLRFSAIRDITARKQAEAERERMLEELARKNKELESVIYVSSHDLRSPLVNIQGFSHRLQTGCAELDRLLAPPQLSPELRAKIEPLLRDRIGPALDFILSSVLKMDTLLSGLLRLSRLGRNALRIETLDMDSLLQSARDSMTFQVEQAGGRLEIGRLPPCRGDSTQVSQVFTNLLDNALKYRSPDRPPVIRITGEVRDGTAIYRVADNGLGIEGRHQEKIWDVFQRLDPNGSVKGEGLGLAIVRRIMDRQDGRAWVESEPGCGSSFFIALPAAAAPSGKEPLDAHRLRAEPSTGNQMSPSGTKPADSICA